MKRRRHALRFILPAILVLLLIAAAFWYTRQQPLDSYSDNFSFSQTVRVQGELIRYEEPLSPGQASQHREYTLALESGGDGFALLIDTLSVLRCGPAPDSLLPRPEIRLTPVGPGDSIWRLRFHTQAGPDPGYLELDYIGGRVTLTVSRSASTDPIQCYLLMEENQDAWFARFIETYGQQELSP